MEDPVVVQVLLVKIMIFVSLHISVGINLGEAGVFWSCIPMVRHHRKEEFCSRIATGIIDLLYHTPKMITSFSMSNYDFSTVQDSYFVLLCMQLLAYAKSFYSTSTALISSPITCSAAADKGTLFFPFRYTLSSLGSKPPCPQVAHSGVSSPI